MQGKHRMAPAVGWSRSFAWSHVCEWGVADSRAGSKNPETRAARIMLLKFIHLHRLQGPFVISGTQLASPEVHCLWEPREVMHQTAGEGPISTRQVQWWIPGCGLTNFSTLAWGSHEQVPAGACAVGRSVFDVPWHWGKSHRNEATCGSCSQASPASGWGTVPGAV